jgi:hypothetical protein
MLRSTVAHQVDDLVAHPIGADLHRQVLPENASRNRSSTALTLELIAAERPGDAGHEAGGQQLVEHHQRVGCAAGEPLIFSMQDI